MSNVGGQREDDIRMRGFGKRTPVSLALERIDRQWFDIGTESVGLRELAGRVLAGAVIAPVNVPGFARSARLVRGPDGRRRATGDSARFVVDNRWSPREPSQRRENRRQRVERDRQIQSLLRVERDEQ